MDAEIIREKPSLNFKSDPFGIMVLFIIGAAICGITIMLVSVFGINENKLTIQILWVGGLTFSFLGIQYVLYRNAGFGIISNSELVLDMLIILISIYLLVIWYGFIIPLIVSMVGLFLVYFHNRTCRKRLSGEKESNPLVLNVGTTGSEEIIQIYEKGVYHGLPVEYDEIIEEGKFIPYEYLNKICVRSGPRKGADQILDIEMFGWDLRRIIKAELNVADAKTMLQTIENFIGWFKLPDDALKSIDANPTQG